MKSILSSRRCIIEAMKTNYCKDQLNVPKSGLQDRSICYSLCDLLCNLKRNAQWKMAILSILLVLCVVFIPDLSVCQYSKLIDLYLSIFPDTLGLSIAAYAIVIGFQSETLKKLLLQEKKKVKPFHVLCSSMIFNGLLQTFVIILAFVYQIWNASLLFYISTILACYTLIQILDILLQLLGLRTFVINSTNNYN